MGGEISPSYAHIVSQSGKELKDDERSGHKIIDLLFAIE